MFPTDLLLSSEWTRVLLSRKPSGFGELQCIRALGGASYPPPLQKGGCGRRLLHSITFPWIIKNQNFRKSTLQHWGKKLSPEVGKRVTNFSSAFQNSKPPFVQETVFSSDVGQRGPLKLSCCGKVPSHFSGLADVLLSMWIHMFFSIIPVI